MKFEIVLRGETTEPVESRPEMERMTFEFCKRLLNLGYPCEAVFGYGAASPATPVAVAEKMPFVTGMSEVRAVPASEQLPPETSFEVEVSAEFEEDMTLAEKIAQLQAAAANAHMSQRELAEALGVTRYAIKKALKG